MGRCQQLYAAPPSLDKCLAIPFRCNLIHRDCAGTHGSHQNLNSMLLAAARQYICAASLLEPTTLWEQLSTLIHYSNAPSTKYRPLSNQISQERGLSTARSAQYQNGTHSTLQLPGNIREISSHPDAQGCDLTHPCHLAPLNYRFPTQTNPVAARSRYVSLGCRGS